MWYDKRMKLRKNIIYILSLLIFTAGVSSAEPLRSPNFDYFGYEDGLSSSSVSSILQDRFGFLYFGTKNGLNRYDGYEVTIFQNDPFDENSLNHNLIQTMYLDGDILWIGTYGGLAKFDTITEQFTRYNAVTGKDDSLSDDVVVAITRDAEGTLWVGTLNGLNRMDEQTGTFTVYRPSADDESSINHQVIRALYSDADGNLWVGTYNGMGLYDRDRDAFTRIRHIEGDPDTIASDLVMDIIQADEHGLYLALWGSGVSYFDTQSFHAVNHQSEENRMYKIIKDDDIIWAASFGGGLLAFDSERHQYSLITSGDDTALPLSNDTVYSLHKDTSGIVWIGTNGGGINRIIPGWESFDLWNKKHQQEAGKVNYLFEDSSQDIWIGTYNSGLERYNRDTGGFEYYRHDETDPESLDNDIVNYVYEDAQNNIWVGTNAGINLFDEQTGSFSTPLEFYHSDENVLNSVSTSMTEDPWGNIWYGTYNNGLIRYDIEQDTYTQYMKDPYSSDALSDNMIRVMLCDSRGDLWLGTNHGLSRYERGSDSFRTYYHDMEDLTSISSHNIYDILEDSKGNLWFGTSGGGVNVYDAESDTFSHFTIGDGLSDNDVLSMEEGPDGSIWLSTRYGLNVISSDREVIRRIDQSSGFPATELSIGACRSSADDLLLFGSISGVVSVDPHISQKQLPPSELVLTDFLVMGEPYVQEYNPYEMKQVVLGPDENYFEFQFTDLQYLSPFKTVYSFMLEGFDETWKQGSTRNFGSYTNIPPGDYTLKIRSMLPDTSWNENAIDLAITIRPPVWKTGIAYFLYALLLLLLLFLIIRYQKLKDAEKSRRLQEQEEINSTLEHLVALRTDQIEQEKNQLEVTLRNITDVVITADEKKNILIMNQQARGMFPDISPEAGHTMNDLFCEHDVKAREAMDAVFEKGRSREQTVPATLGGMRKMLQIACAPLEDSRHIISGRVFVIRDITEGLELQQRLQKHDKLESLGVLAGGIAHDFNNLLVGIFGYIQIAAAQAEDAQVKELLELAAEPFDRAKDLTRQLLTFAKGGEPVKSTRDISSILENSMKFVLSGSSVGTELSIEASLYHCDIDENQFSQVIDNLLLNAKQACGKKGLISLLAQNTSLDASNHLELPAGDYVRVSITDDGPGIDEELLPKIFDPFFTTKTAGSGLGLTTAYSIMRRHGGLINVTSRTGEGTTFTLLLPRSREPMTKAPEQDNPVNERKTCSGTLLLLDDEQMILELLERNCRSMGFSVVTVTDGADIPEMLKTLQKKGEKLIGAVLDLTIPGGVGGVEAAELISEQHAGIPLIASSGYASDPVIADPEKFGFAASLRKPYRSQEVIEILSEVFASETAEGTQ